MSRRVLGKSTTLLGGGRKQQSLNHNCQELIHGKDEVDEVKRSCHGRVANSTPWVPHPRTGIYYPKGYEWVMEDVPIGASSFPQSFWLRSSEALEKPSSNVSHSGDVFDHPFLNN